LEQSKEAYEEALTSLGQKKEAAYPAGLYNGCINLYLMMEDEEIFSLEEADVERLDEEIKAVCFEAMSMSQDFWQNLLEDGS